ncbi:MAG: hypothetical protein GWP10_03635 [Nitrospiraceae bacterium]|nr:hypothetical protein [Nitrospiraceae bacterium]
MEQDIGKALAYQIKRDIAERYFGSRKIIEEDRQAVEAMISELSLLYTNTVGKDMLRIYALLRDPKLIDGFLGLIGWNGRPFFDRHVIDSATDRKQLFKGMTLHGWTDLSKFVHLVLDSYKRLYRDLYRCREKLDDILDEISVIKEEIGQFKRKFSLDEIMNFIRTLDRRDELVGVLGENEPVGKMEDLSARLALPPLDDIEKSVPELPELPPLDKIEAPLKDLAHRVSKVYMEEGLELIKE